MAGRAFARHGWNVSVAIRTSLAAVRQCFSSIALQMSAAGKTAYVPTNARMIGLIRAGDARYSAACRNAWRRQAPLTQQTRKNDGCSPLVAGIGFLRLPASS